MTVDVPADPTEGAGAPPPAIVRYDRDIRPLLSDRCFVCHGRDEKQRRAELRLDDPAGALAERENGAALVPGDPDASELWLRVTHASPKKRMPPESSRKKALNDDEQALLKRWIEQGARYEPHWSFVPPTRPPVPAVKHEAWCRNEIDRFVAAKLEEQGVEPGPEADRATQLRRLFLELTGLPPTPEERAAFLADARPDAYEQWVDKLLDEEPWRSRFAERMATPWLDAARYADTCGIHTDAGRQIWPWRDWLLQALRDHMPFDQFVVKQLAGDLLPGATDADRIASGFHRNHVTTDEGGAIAEEYLVEYAVDRVATTGSVFMALTLGCARCHDHKYDPITQRDFYSLFAFFNSIEEPGLYSQLPDSNRAFEPAMKVANAAQREEEAQLDANLERARAALAEEPPQEREEEAKFVAGQAARSGVAWAPLELVRATARGGATLAPQPDGSLLASGPNPAQDDFEIVVRTQAEGLRLLRLDALTDPSLNGRVGRAFNGNAVVSGVELVATSLADPKQQQPVRFTWAWADVEQQDGDYRVVDVLDPDPFGWAVAAHQQEGERSLLLLAEQPFGFAGGSELRVTLQFRSIYAEHSLGRVRLGAATIADAALDALPTAQGGWHVAGPFAVADRAAVFDATFGPEQERRLDRKKKFGPSDAAWRFDATAVDGVVNDLPGGVIGVDYVARRLFAPSARRVEASLGSDDSFRLYLDGKEIAANKVDRPAAADQERIAFDLPAGEHLLVIAVGNTGGPSAFYWRGLARAGELAGALVASLFPAEARPAKLAAALHEAWKQDYSPGWRERREKVAQLEQQRAAIEARLPQTMVMKEAMAPRPAFVLKRGEYDKPDAEQPVGRAVPAALGALPPDAPKNRLGLAQWLVSKEQPLVARVAVNRWWELLFGTGIVATSEDFGYQGEWPSHPELLDWLAVEFRDGGWDVRALVRRLVTSATFRQSSQTRPDVRARDPQDRWLAWYPRRRLDAEQLRDQALYVSGLLVERLGGPSAKPYQPDGLWQEVAMPASNTRFFVRGQGDELWRRSLYTYWKRACPPPSLQTFDAPTREFCTIRRTPTSTPLQALVLWNDEQFVEAARALATRTLHEAGDDAARLARMHLRCTSREPDRDEAARLAAALAKFRARYGADVAAAKQLVEVGEAPTDAALPPEELAAWTLVASALLQLDATICRG